MRSPYWLRPKLRVTRLPVKRSTTELSLYPLGGKPSSNRWYVWCSNWFNWWCSQFKEWTNMVIPLLKDRNKWWLLYCHWLGELIYLATLVGYFFHSKSMKIRDTIGMPKWTPLADGPWWSRSSVIQHDYMSDRCFCKTIIEEEQKELTIVKLWVIVRIDNLNFWYGSTIWFHRKLDRPLQYAKYMSMG